MKVIIAGSRDLSLSTNAIEDAVKASGFDVHEVVSGGARGVDRSGERWAHETHCLVRIFQAEWEKYRRPGRKNPAGPIRNGQMAEYADALIAIYRKGKLTPGTLDMIRQARAKSLRVYEHEV